MPWRPGNHDRAAGNPPRSAHRSPCSASRACTVLATRLVACHPGNRTGGSHDQAARNPHRTIRGGREARGPPAVACPLPASGRPYPPDHRGACPRRSGCGDRLPSLRTGWPPTGCRSRRAGWPGAPCSGRGNTYETAHGAHRGVHGADGCAVGLYVLNRARITGPRPAGRPARRGHHRRVVRFSRERPARRDLRASAGRGKVPGADPAEPGPPRGGGLSADGRPAATGAGVRRVGAGVLHPGKAIGQRRSRGRP